MNYFSTLKEVYIVAEIGVNHNGDLNLAKQLICAAKAAGANAVKFQSFTADKLAITGTPKVDYQLASTSLAESHFEMLKKLELSREAHRILKDFSRSVKIDFLSTPYDVESAQFLLSLNVPFFKTASADLVDIPLQKFIAKSGIPAMVATGMSSLGEIEHVVNLYRKACNNNLILLHAVSNYPCKDGSINLLSMTTMANAFNLPVGFSDHSIGSLAATLSVAFGARVIEKHFTLDKSLSGPDHMASSSPAEFSELVSHVRRAEKIIGNSIKECQPEESQMSDVSRKSITIVENMRAGETLTIDKIRMMRPGKGIRPIFLAEILGKTISRNINAGEQLKWSDLRI